MNPKEWLQYILDKDIRYDFKWKYIKPTYEVIGPQMSVVNLIERQLWDDLVHEPILADNPGT